MPFAATLPGSLSGAAWVRMRRSPVPRLEAAGMREELGSGGGVLVPRIREVQMTIVRVLGDVWIRTGSLWNRRVGLALPPRFFFTMTVNMA